MVRRSALLTVVCLMLCMFAVQVLAVDVMPSDDTSLDIVKLEYKFKPGDVMRYKMVMDLVANIQMNMPNGGQIPPTPMKMVSVCKYQVKRILENGDAEVACTMESMKIEVMGSVQEMPADQKQTVTMIMSKNGSTKITKAPNAKSGIFAGLPLESIGSSGQYSLFPNKALLVDDEWTQDIPSPFGGGKLTSKGKLLSKDTVVAGYKVAKYSEDITGDIAITPPAPKEGQAASAVSGMDIKGKYTVKGTGNFAIAEGKMVSSSGTMDIQMAMAMPFLTGDSGEPLNIKLTGSYQSFLAPPAPAAKTK